VIREDYGDLGLPDARRSEQQKAAARSAGFAQTEFTALERGDNARQRVGLTADFAGQ
jgi:hypothetical protein